MSLHWPTFFTRLGSAVVFSAVMLCGLLWKDWMFVALIALIQALCLRDYFRIMARIEEAPFPKWVQPLAQCLSMVTVLCFGWLQLAAYGNMVAEAAWWNFLVTRAPLFAMASGVLLFILHPVFVLLATALSAKSRIRQGFAAIGGLFYITVPALLLLGMHSIAWYIPLVLVLMIWTNDTMAYLVGSFIGRTPFSSISPKKTWEGTAGGAVLTVAGAVVAAWLIPGQSLLLYAGLALCAAIAGTAGDLLESKLKRLAGVKDSGTLMPGHGGALDRFDSLLVAVPFAFAWVVVCRLAGLLIGS